MFAIVFFHQFLFFFPLTFNFLSTSDVGEYLLYIADIVKLWENFHFLSLLSLSLYLCYFQHYFGPKSGSNCCIFASSFCVFGFDFNQFRCLFSTTFLCPITQWIDANHWMYNEWFTMPIINPIQLNSLNRQCQTIGGKWNLQTEEKKKKIKI